MQWGSLEDKGGVFLAKIEDLKVSNLSNTAEKVPSPSKVYNSPTSPEDLQLNVPLLFAAKYYSSEMALASGNILQFFQYTNGL